MIDRGKVVVATGQEGREALLERGGDQ